MYADLSLKNYLKETAASTPVPGGGSVAALSASLAAALAEMVAGLTIGRNGFEAVHAEMEEICREAAAMRIRCIEDIDRDPEAYQKVLDSFRLPKESREQKEIRAQSIQEAMKGAALVPLSLAENACRIMSMADSVVQKGNKNAVTDGAVAAMMARSAGLAALYNVRINLTAVKDEDFVKDITRKVNSLEKVLISQEKDILSHVEM
jgi:formiminotetrahydrofolate cyclodeaminase